MPALISSMPSTLLAGDKVIEGALVAKLSAVTSGAASASADTTMSTLDVALDEALERARWTNGAPGAAAGKTKQPAGLAAGATELA